MVRWIRTAMAAAVVWSTALVVHAQELSPFTRLTFGVEQAGASSADSALKYQADFFISGPLARRSLEQDGTTYPHLPWLLVFGDFRFNSTTQTSSANVKDFVSNFVNNVQQTNVNELVQGMLLKAGVEVTPFGLGPAFGAFKQTIDGAEVPMSSHLAASFIFDVGATTPLSPQNRLQAFQFNQAVVDQVKQMNPVPDEFQPLLNADPAKIKTVAFVTPDRSRFFRQVFGGLRLKTYDVNDDTHEIVATRGMIDLELGADEEITGGTLKKWVGRLEAFYKLPETPVYVFGTALLHFAESVNTTPLIMQAATSVSIPAADTLVLPIAQADRDVWKVGVAVDLLPLFTNAFKSSGSKPAGQ